jgi:putative ABC transport system ATP-binding protein
MAADILIEAKNIHKTFMVGNQQVQILKNVNFKVITSDYLIIFGPSGCGKSTLLHTILGLEPPSEGQVVFLGHDLYANTNEDDRAVLRKQHVGMIYQQPNWIKSLTVIENIAFPLTLLGMSHETAFPKAMEQLEGVEMANWAHYRPNDLSSGQQQRIALARALINNPQVIIADEPTGNLDFESGKMVMKLLQKLNDEQHKTIIMVTHDLEYLQYSKSAVRMLDGQVVGLYDESNKDELLQELHFKRGVTTSQKPLDSSAPNK